MSLGFTLFSVCGLLRFVHNAHHVAAPDFPNLILGAAVFDQFDRNIPQCACIHTIFQSSVTVKVRSDAHVIDTCNFDNVDLIAVKDLLGHHSVRTTARYTHSNKEQKLKAVELLRSKNSRKKAENVVNFSLIRQSKEKKNLKGL